MNKITDFAAAFGTPYALVDGGNACYAIQLLTQDEANEQNENMPHEEFYWTPVELHFPAPVSAAKKLQLAIAQRGEDRIFIRSAIYHFMFKEYPYPLTVRQATRKMIMFFQPE